MEILEAFYDWQDVTLFLRGLVRDGCLYIPEGQVLFTSDPAPMKAKSLWIKWRYQSVGPFLRVYHEYSGKLDNIVLLGIPKPAQGLPRTFQQKEFYRSLFTKKGHYLEIDGPSDLFDSPSKGLSNALNIYSQITSKSQTLDNMSYSRATADERFLINGKPYGKTIVMDPIMIVGSSLEATYDVIFSAHYLQRTANPLRVITGWKKLLRVGGYLLVIVPWNDPRDLREATPFEHLLEDYTDNVGEDDLTHVSEVLETCDLRHDKSSGDIVTFRQRCLKNVETRILTHHVFSYESLISLSSYLQLKVIDIDLAGNADLLVILRKS